MAHWGRRLPVADESSDGLRLAGVLARRDGRQAADPKNERYTGELSARANALVTGEYRKPFVVPHNL